MKLQQKIYSKFSILLIMSIVFIALPVVTVAQGKKVTIDFCKTDKTYAGGIHIAVSDLTSDAPPANRIYVSRISLLTGAFDGGVGVVNSCDPDAASKIKMLFDVRRNLRLTNDIVVSIPENNTPESFQALNYLRHAQASGESISEMELIVVDSRNQQDYKVKLEEVLVSSWQTGASPNASGETFGFSFGVEYEYKP